MNASVSAYGSLVDGKPALQGAAEMGQVEHLLNVYASKSTKNSIANFVGYAQVLPDEATKTLTEGLWLVSEEPLNFVHCLPKSLHKQP